MRNRPLVKALGYLPQGQQLQIRHAMITRNRGDTYSREAASLFRGAPVEYPCGDLSSPPGSPGLGALAWAWLWHPVCAGRDVTTRGSPFGSHQIPPSPGVSLAGECHGAHRLGPHWTPRPAPRVWPGCHPARAPERQYKIIQRLRRKVLRMPGEPFFKSARNFRLSQIANSEDACADLKAVRAPASAAACPCPRSRC
jgi:hypothetical protein